MSYVNEEEIDAPSHYVAGRKFEPIDVIEAWGMDNSFHLGNAMKYLSRAGRKEDTIKDLKKASWYLRRYRAKRGNVVAATRVAVTPEPVDVTLDWGIGLDLSHVLVAMLYGDMDRAIQVLENYTRELMQ